MREDGPHRRLEKELAVRPGAQSGLVQSSALHQPLGGQDSRGTRGGREDSRQIWL